MCSRNSKKVKCGRYRKAKRQNGRSGWKSRAWTLESSRYAKEFGLFSKFDRNHWGKTLMHLLT